MPRRHGFVQLTFLLAASASIAAAQQPSEIVDEQVARIRASDIAAPGLSLAAHVRISAVYDFAVVPPYVYANERGILRVLDVSDPRAVREVGSLEVRPPRTRMAVRGSYLYMRGFNAPLAVIDVSRPSEPRLTSELPHVVAAPGHSFALAADVALVVRRDESPSAGSAPAQQLYLDILDLARDPVRPPVVHSVDLGVRAAGEFGAVKYADGRAFVIVGRPLGADSRSQLVIVDVRDPARAQVERRVHFPAGLNYRSLEVRGDLLYVVQWGRQEARENGLSIWRLRPEGDPEPLGTATNVMLRYPNTIILHGDVAYLTVKGVPTFVTIDISDPRTPRIVHAHIENENWAGGLGLALQDNRLYVSGDQGPAGIFDVSVSDAPRHLGRWFNGGAVRQVLRTGSSLIAQSLTDLLFYDVSNLGSPPGRHEAVPLYWTGGVYQTHVVVGASGTRLVAAYESIPAEVLDIGDRSRPVVLGRFEPAGLVHAIALSPTHAFLGYRAPAAHRRAVAYEPGSLSRRGGIGIVDLRNPSAPQMLPGLSLDGVVTDVALNGDKLVAAHHDGALSVIDARDPAQPRVLAQLPGSGTAAVPFAFATARVTLSADGRYAYLTQAALPADGDPYGDGMGTLSIIDIADAARPRVLSRIEFERRGDASVPVASHGRRVAVLMGALGGVMVLDVSDPGKPALIAHEPLLPGTYAEGLAMDETQVYVGASEDGVLVYALPE